MVYLHHDALWIAHRDAFGGFSRVWDEGIRLGFPVKNRTYFPLDWTRLARSSWAIGSTVNDRHSCSNYVKVFDFPEGLLENKPNVTSLRAKVFKEHATLGATVARLNTKVTQVLDSYFTTHPTRQDPEGFLGTVALHADQPLGPITLQCASALFAYGRRPPSTLKIGLLPGRHTMRC